MVRWRMNVLFFNNVCELKNINKLYGTLNDYIATLEK